MTTMPMPVLTPPAPDSAAMQAMPGMNTRPGNPGSVASPMSPMQGGPAPADARDSFDYSGGFSRSVMPGAEASDGLRLGAVFVEQFEAVETNQGSGSAWDVQAWYGGPFDKAWLRTQGDRRGGRTETASVEALWFRPFHPFWGTQLGVRQDFGEGPNRTWAALGVQGVAPYWNAVEATAYVGEDGRTAARLKIATDLRVTQRLVLRPDVEANLFGRSDAARRTGSGLSSTQVGLRLRYEFRREFAPYIGVAWNHGFGETRELRRLSGDPNDEVQWIIGFQVWR
ncbi:copper resistance protein B [Brevundimonas mediterranea]|jgi:copper resistance protein B|uniref:Copper resistance protein B n=1 Tax=Brevundimonas mediterranea TaxID=74329 RepID=A0A7W6F0F2_9CAUL|nr:copper resistance protein B [Brevundimonas mediterranea]MBB3873026.1 copper resistance protein B [Brevundimonas mediterranea]